MDSGGAWTLPKSIVGGCIFAVPSGNTSVGKNIREIYCPRKDPGSSLFIWPALIVVSDPRVDVRDEDR